MAQDSSSMWDESYGGNAAMTESKQGGPEKTPPAARRTEPHVERDPSTGINRDMPSHQGEAEGNPRNLTFGGPNHT